MGANAELLERGYRAMADGDVATGAEFDVAEVHIWEVRDGKAVDFRAHIDTPAMRAALEA